MATTPYRWTRVGVHRVLSDLIRAELARLGHDPAGWGHGLVPETAVLGGDTGIGAALDSFARLAVASEVAEWFGVRATGLEDLLLARRGVGEWLDVLERSLRANDAVVTFRTSGSTDRPRPVTHALSDLSDEAAWFAGRLAARKRIVALVPAHHIYGFLFTVLLPAHLRVDVVEGRDWNPAGFAGKLRAGDLVIGHPAVWSLIARAGTPLPPDVAGVTSSAPCPDDLAQALDALGVRPLLQVYGSTETGGVGMRDRPEAPFHLLPRWQRAGADLRRADRDAEPSAPGVELMDRIEWTSSTEFHVLGRKDHTVQVAGHNVNATQVRNVLLSVPGVTDAAVRKMAPHEGAYLKAFLAIDPGLDPGTVQDSARRILQEHLSPYSVPRHLSLGPALPRGATGKPSDWAIATPTPGANPQGTADAARPT